MQNELRTAAQQALEALEDDAMQRTFAGGVRISNAALALRAALAEPVQEPVAWRVMLPDGYQFVYDERMLRVIDEGIHATRQPLYTSPPQRKPLTEEDIQAAWDSVDMRHPRGNETRIAFARAIESKLQEKNT